MTRLLLITPKVDPDDDLFGHVATWADALARRVDRLYIVSLWDTRPPLPPNARLATLGKGATPDRLLWLARLQARLVSLCAGGRIDAILAHMAPIFAVAAAPLARYTAVPLFLWYAHGHVSPMLKLAHILVDGVGTSTADGFRIPSEKVSITGQGIDTVRFRPVAGASRAGHVVSVGRFSPIKDHHVVLEAFARLVADARQGAATPTLDVIGGTHSPAEETHLRSLRERAKRLGVADRVHFVVGVPHHAMPARYREAEVFVSASRTGSLDKAVLEAAACGAVPLVCNPAFRGLFEQSWGELSFREGAEAELAALLRRWLGRPDAERASIAGRLRASIEREHSVEHWADAVLGMMFGCR